MKYIGIKQITAEPMKAGMANQLGLIRDYEESMSGDDGYKVTYENGYESWSPKEVFEAAYSPLSNGKEFSFGMAIEFMKLNKKVARKGWNGKNMFLFLVPGSKFKVNRPPLLGIYPEGTEVEYQSHIDMKTAQGTVVPWLASQSDVLANDWVIVE